MKVIKEEGGPLVDAEVLEWLKDCQIKRRRRKKRKRDDSTISDGQNQLEIDLHEALTLYFDKMPAKTQNSKKDVVALFEKLEEYGLAPAEKLMIANHRPDKLVHVNAIIRDCDTRLADEQLDKILEIVNEVLPEPPKLLEDLEQEEEDAEGGQAEGEMDVEPS